ncbi:hypothetical protein [Clostridium sp.]|uniref:hypothetical protein n=1 Tax=Clostridium sp. TaxID=1506 RepID=UPI003D6CF0EC
MEMIFINIKKKVLISSVSIIAILATVYFYYYYFNKIKPYNDALNKANKAIVVEEYDKALAAYTEALSYKKDVNISDSVDFAKLLKKSKENYDLADKQMNDKKYLDAIDIFIKVDKQDNKRYSITQNKIIECMKSYIADSLNNANDSLKINKFDDANKYIDNVLKVDANNSDAKKLKDDITKTMQRQNEDESNRKAQQEEKVKLNSAGTFISEDTLLKIKEGRKNDPNDLSSSIVELSNIKKDKAEIRFVFMSTGGSVRGGSGVADYKGNGKWVFEYDSTYSGEEHLIGTMIVKGENAELSERIDSEPYKFVRHDY